MYSWCKQCVAVIALADTQAAGGINRASRNYERSHLSLPRLCILSKGNMKTTVCRLASRRAGSAMAHIAGIPGAMRVACCSHASERPQLSG